MARRSIRETIPIAVREVLYDLGRLIEAARRERGFSQRELADRVGVGRVTILRMEKGDPGIAMGWYLAACWLLGLPVLSFADLATTRHDSAVASFLAGLERHLPQRVRGRRKEPDRDF